VRIRAACLLGLLDNEDEGNTFFETSIIMSQLCTNCVSIVYQLCANRHVLTSQTTLYFEKRSADSFI